MDNLIYTSERQISSAYIDSSVRLGVAQTLLLAQDNLTECFGMLGCDGVVYRDKFNAFWVLTKMMVHFNARPGWRDTVTVRTFPIDNARIRTHVNTEVLDSTGNSLISINQEACVLSFDTHRPMKLTDLPYPADNFPPAVMNEPFNKFPDDFTEDDFVFEQTIRSCHIDMSHHMNNIEYIRLALSVFTDDYRRQNEITDMELHYLGESQEGQTLRVYRRDSDGKCYIYIMQDNRKVFECSIAFR